MAPLSDHSFYAAMLRFIAAKTDVADERMAAMMAALTAAAGEIETGSGFTIAADRLEIAARAFAGVAAFLQKQILPEVVADTNQAGERQVRWAIDTAMDAVNALLARAALREGEAVSLELPPPP
jgi:hypothetical protein